MSNLKRILRRLALKPRRQCATPNPVPPAHMVPDFLNLGDLVFDVGAHKGQKTDAFLEAGAAVVCVEPQPKCVEALRAKYNNQPRVTIEAKGVADKPGQLPMSVCSVAPTISTFADSWKQGCFADYQWDQTIAVEVTTLDALVAKHGLPKYCKVDVEGFELEVIKGLTIPVPYLSFEFTVEFLDLAEKCVAHLSAIGFAEFNFMLGEQPCFSLPQWVGAEALFAALKANPDPSFWGDIYARCPPPHLQPGVDGATQLQRAGLWRPDTPLRLHLGCGEQHLPGYVNMDFPPAKHTVQNQTRADVHVDLRKLCFAPESVEEIRLHHVLEHFTRAEALALLIRWHEWLRVGGRLRIETPDMDGCARQLAGKTPYDVKQSVLRHCFGSQEADWAHHLDGWSEAKFNHVLGQLGFQVQTRAWHWPQPPHLANVEAIGTKAHARTREELLATADEILKDSMVADVASERAMWCVWCRDLRKFVAGQVPASAPAGGSAVALVASRLRNLTVHPDALPYGAAGFNNDNPDTNGEHHLLAALIRPGDTVFDVGANVGDWSRWVSVTAENLKLHAFEPAPDTLASLQKNLCGIPAQIYPLALADKNATKSLFCYLNQPDLAGMNSLYRRPVVEHRLHQQPKAITITTQMLDSFCAQHRIEEIHFLKIDTEGAELAVLRGANGFLAAHRIGFIQFEYGGTYQDAGITLREVYTYLTGLGYQLYRIVPDGLVRLSQWQETLENYQYANYLAVTP